MWDGTEVAKRGMKEASTRASRQRGAKLPLSQNLTPSETEQPMRTLTVFLTIGSLAFLGSTAMAQGPREGGNGQGIAAFGSPHNFADDDDPAHPELPASGGWNQREEICRVCHVPHDHANAAHYGDVGLLWNHALSSATYTMYSSGTLDGAIASQPTGYSKMCLGCHDGTVGIDTFDKYAGGTVFIQDFDADWQIPSADYAGDLGKTHPISIEYDETADPNLQPKTATMGGSGTIADVLEGGTILQCSSCHDVHDQPGESVPGTHLLRVGQTAATGTPSGLCLTCHIK